jgi:hypothetical protein
MGTLRGDIGKWSAGCLGVMDRHWPEFWTRSAERQPQSEYWLYLLDAWRYAKWIWATNEQEFSVWERRG